MFRETKSPTSLKLAAGLALCLLLPCPLRAQEYFRTLTTSMDLATVQPPPEPKYNITLGSGAGVNLSAGLGVEYNDNVNLAPNGQRESDVIFRPSVEADATWRMSDLNTLRFSIGVSYAKYLNHTEFDTLGVLLSPNSALAVTFQAGPVLITLRDRFSYQEDPFDLPVLSGVADYRRMENTASAQVDWPITQQTTLTAGYEHYNLWTFESQFRSLDRGIETVFAKPSYLIGQNVTVGASASGSYVYYLHPGQNNGVDYMTGLFANVGITRSTHLEAEAGYQSLTFDQGGLIGDNSGSRNWYARGEINHQLTEYFSHHVIFSKSAELGFGQNFYDLYHAEYGADWRIMRELTLTPTFFYENYETSGPHGEIGNRYGAAIGTRWSLTSTITLGVDYRFLLKNSNLPGLGYEQDLVMLSAFYSF